MTDLLSSSGVVRDIGWTLIHFLWQGLLLAALLNMVLPMYRSAVARHNWALGTLAAMALTPVITFLSIHDFGRSGGAAVQGSAATAMPAPASISMPWIDWLVVFWLVGIAVLSLRALGGWYVAGSLKRLDTLSVPADLLQRCRGLQRRLAVTAPVRFLLSRRVAVPVVIGWLRPVILIPVSALAGLPPQQLDALILHELAHIRRLDTVINVMLVAVETLLFYHPAIWWVSRRIRIEREHCCDDFAVMACGDAAIYVEALTSLETWKGAGGLALAANGGRLKDRVARLLEPSESRRFSLSAMAGLAFLSLIVASVATAQTKMQTGAHQFAIRVVDESVDQNAKVGPPGDERVSMMEKGKRVYLWLKRESELSGDMLADAQAGSSNGKPVVYFRLTQEGSNRFSALTRENVGHRLAVIVNGTVIDAPTIKTPILGGQGQLTGDFTTEAEAKTLADEMMGTKDPATPATTNSRQGAISNAKLLQRVTLDTSPHKAEAPTGAAKDAVAAKVRTQRQTKYAELTERQPVATPPAASAPDAQQSADSGGIVATVNDEPISEDELRRRVGLIIASSGLKQPSPEDMKRVRATSLEQLEDEAIERQEAVKRRITVNPAEIDQIVNRMIASNKMTADQLSATLTNAGSSEATLRAQIAANLAWQKVVQATVAAQHPGQDVVDPAEIKRIADAELARVKAELAHIGNGSQGRKNRPVDNKKTAASQKCEATAR